MKKITIYTQRWPAQQLPGGLFFHTKRPANYPGYKTVAIEIDMPEDDDLFGADVTVSAGAVKVEEG